MAGKSKTGGRKRRLIFWRRDKAPARSASSTKSKPAGGGRGLLIALCLIGAAGLVGGFLAMEQTALTGQGRTSPDLIGVQIIDPPEWMPEALAQRIVADILPADADYLDDDLSRRVHDLAVAHPWIRSVESVRKRRTPSGKEAYFELLAEFRQPIAQAGWQGTFYYIDAEGVRLPDPPGDLQVPKFVVEAAGESGQPPARSYLADRKDAPVGAVVKPIHYIIIDGVAAPPVAPGQAWPGEDLADGLRLVHMLLGCSYADQITVVNVLNHRGRISATSPEITVFAQVGKGRATEIRFGRFPTSDGDWVVPPDKKLANLDAYVTGHNGQLAGVHEYIDLRYDELHASINRE